MNDSQFATPSPTGELAVAPHTGMSESLVVGTTSHRNLCPVEVEDLAIAVRALFLRLRADFPQLPLTIVSSLAAGGDQLVAEQALALGARLVAPLPLPRAEYARDFTDAADRARFDALCAQATVIELPMVSGAALGIDDDDPRARDWHYAQAGVYVASHCHLLLALWDGKDTDLLGGTSQIVQYHLSGIKPELIERRRTTSVRNPLGENNERLAFHIVCSRDQSDGAPASPLQPLQTFWRTGESAIDGAGPMPQEFRAMFERIAELNDDTLKYVDEIAAATAGADHSRSRGYAGLAAIERRFAVADWLALHFQRRVLFAMRTLYTLAALMGIAFIVYDQLSQRYMIFAFLALFACGVTLDVLARKRGWHRKYLDYRALAEGLRVQAYWRRAGLSMTGDAEFAHDNFLQKQDVELGWIRNVMRSAGLDADDAPDLVVDPDRVIEEWVGRSGQSGQLHYYERRVADRSRTHRLTEWLGGFSLWAGIAICIFLAATITALSDDWRTILVSVMGALSVIAAVREAYAYRKADKELIKQYRFMRRIFANARTALDRATGADQQREILRALGEAALAEHAEWTLMHRERPLERARI